MKLEELRNYINAGLNDAQITAIIKSKKPEQKPEQKPEETDKFDRVIAAINRLTETIQASNIAGAENKEPETVDDIFESLIIED